MKKNIGFTAASIVFLCDELGIPQPAWHEVGCEADLDRVGYPVWVKAAYSTAGRGVRRPYS